MAWEAFQSSGPEVGVGYPGQGRMELPSESYSLV